VQCTFGSNSGLDTHKHHGLTATRDTIAARLRKPEGFRGSPIFADDRQVDPLIDVSCQIRPDKSDTEELTYNLLISDFSRCGVLKRNVSLLLVVLLVVCQFLKPPHCYSFSESWVPNSRIPLLKESSLLGCYAVSIGKKLRTFQRKVVNFFHRLPHICSESHSSIYCYALFVLIFSNYNLKWGPGISVGIATDYGLDGPGSNPGGDEVFRPPKPALGPTQPPVKWVPGLSRG